MRSTIPGFHNFISRTFANVQRTFAYFLPNERSKLKKLIFELPKNDKYKFFVKINILKMLNTVNLTFVMCKYHS
jgi:hypothetical protein